MLDSEKILGKTDTKEFYITENHFVFVNSKSHDNTVGAGGLVGAVIGEGINYFLNKRADKINEKNRLLTLDEKVQKIKGSFAFLYNDINEITLSKTFGGGQINIRGKKFWKLVEFSRDDFNQLESLLPTLSSLKDKLIINH